MRGEEEAALHDDATWLLDFYETFKEFVTADVTENALSSLAQVLGRFGAQPCFVHQCLTNNMTCPRVQVPHIPSGIQLAVYSGPFAGLMTMLYLQKRASACFL